MRVDIGQNILANNHYFKLTIHSHLEEPQPYKSKGQVIDLAFASDFPFSSPTVPADRLNSMVAHFPRAPHAVLRHFIR